MDFGPEGEGIESIMSMGGEELMRHEHGSNSIMYSAFGEDWRR